MIKIIVGIGNIGPKYENTIHNFGFIAIDYLLEAFNLNLNHKKQMFNGLIWEFFHNDQKIIFAKPLTYVNNTIFFLLSVINFYKIHIENILIIYDDITLKKWKVFVKDNGSGNYHLGMENIITGLKTKKIKRIKIGALNIFTDQRKICDKVLSKCSVDEIKNNFPFLEIKNIVDHFINNEFDLAKQKYR
ncbi:aminoacyl-tRNA hydrolase [symbiont of Argiope bruennichi]|uniref:aminoacyl-tRNA hydrolase n=1 Tax=symbiont of Argiope bruennichi TaxID=2810479 RepID=UPI003DA48508